MGLSSFLKRPVTLNKSTLILSGLLLVITQLLISQWTVEAAGDRDVIDFVSFAGTIVGLILAVLAIIYSYIATASQKDDAEGVRAQIAALNDAVSRASSTNNLFSQELTRLEGVREELANVSTLAKRNIRLVEDVHDKVGQLTARQVQTRTRRIKKAELDSIGTPATQQMAPELLLAENAAFDQLFMYFLAVYDTVADASEDDTKKAEFSAFSNQFVHDGLAHDDTTFYADVQRGEYLGYYFVLKDLGATEPGRFRAFLQALLNRFQTVDIALSPSYLYKPEAAEAKMAAAKTWLENELKDRPQEGAAID